MAKLTFPVMDAQGEVRILKYDDVVDMYRVNRKMVYETESDYFYEINDMEKYEKALRSLGFVLVGRKDLINKNHIQGIDSDGNITLSNGKVLKPTRRRKKNVLQNSTEYHI